MMRTKFVHELEEVRGDLVEMGETTIALLGEALRAVGELNPELAERASELEAKTDHQHRFIHDRCLSLITLQAPVASDARLLTGILDSIVDLELIGDYAYEIVTLAGELERRPPSQISAQIAEAGAKIRDLLSVGVESWRCRDRAQAMSVRPQEAAIRPVRWGLCQAGATCVGSGRRSRLCRSHVSLQTLEAHSAACGVCGGAGGGGLSD
jgi:phosphate transport system protein